LTTIKCSADELREVAADPGDGHRGRFAAGDVGRGQLLDRRAHPVEQAGADPRVDRFQLGLTLGDQPAVDRPAHVRQAQGLVVQTDVADFMSAEDEVGPVGQFQAVQWGRAGDESDWGYEPLFQGRPTYRHRGGHAAARSY
jgi:hypothetical protein